MLEDQDIKLEVTDDAVKLIASLGYDPLFGARPLKRVLQQKVLNELSKMILSGQLNGNSTITIGEKDQEFTYHAA